MICYRDRTFCSSPGCTGECGRFFSPADAVQAVEWGGAFDAPVAFSSFCPPAEPLMPPTLEQLEAQFPDIKWREPVIIETPTQKGLACRICIAQHGFLADADGYRLFAVPAEFVVHLQEAHL